MALWNNYVFLAFASFHSHSSLTKVLYSMTLLDKKPILLSKENGIFNTIQYFNQDRSESTFILPLKTECLRGKPQKFYEAQRPHS